MKKSVLFVPILAMAFVLLTLCAQPASAETILSNGLLSKISASILVWDATSGSFTTQKVSHAEVTSVTENNVSPITIQVTPNPAIGDTAYIEGAMLLSNGKVYLEYNGYVTASDSKAAGNCWVYVRMVTDGNIVFDSSGNVTSGTGHIVYFDSGSSVKIAAKQDSGGNIIGIIKFAVSPYDGTYEEYTGGVAGADVATPVKVKAGPIKFVSYDLIP